MRRPAYTTEKNTCNACTKNDGTTLCIHHDAQRRCLTGYSNGKNVGSLDYQFKKDSNCYVAYLQVKEKYRNKNYGTAFLDEMQVIAAQQGCNKLTLIVATANFGAQKLYTRRGFKLVMCDPFSEPVHDYFFWPTFYFMEKQLKT